jgi:NCS1 family nucleobase:cation symporter-1
VVVGVSGDNGGLEARASAEGWWPLTQGERNWGTVALMGVSVSAAVATWVFIIGGTVAFYLDAVAGSMAMIAGSLVGILLVVLAVLPVASRFGIDSIAALRPQMGNRGAYFGLVLMTLSVVGWNSVLMIFLGRASVEILVSLGLVADGSRGLLVPLFSVASIVGVWFVLRRGPEAMQKTGTAVAAVVTLLGVFIVVLLVKEVGWSTIMDAEPLAPSSSKLYNYTTGFEMLAAINLAWWPYVGGLVRSTSGARKALWPVVIGLGLPVSALSLIGLFAALAVPESGGDPTKFLIELGGVSAGVPALAFIILANFGTALVGTYIAALGLAQVPSFQGRLSWNLSTALGILPVAVVAGLFGSQFFDNIGVFLAFLGVTFAPICGIQIADYYVLKRRPSLRGMFIHGPGTPYHYWRGFNPVGIVGLLAGVATYMYLLNPLTYESNPPYEYVSATLPAAFVAGLVYAVLMKWVMPSERTAVKDASAAEPSVVD